MADIRNPNSTIEPFTLYARQRNPDGTLMVVQLKWDAKSVCTGAGLVATEKESGNLQVTALGNPTRSETVEVEVSGGAGQRIQLEVTNLQGQPISELLLDQRTTPVRVRLWVGPSAGLRLIRACTATQQKIIKILKQ